MRYEPIDPMSKEDAERAAASAHPFETPDELRATVLELWREAMDLAATTLTVFPETRLAGMDIAVTTSGPVVIELNNYPGLDGVGVSNLQLGKLLQD